MFQSILRLTRQSAIYGIGHVLTKAVVIFLLPIHTNFVSPREYGIATQLLVFLGIMAIIYSYGLNSALLQFFILENDRDRRKKYFSTAFIATAITALVFSIVLYVTRNFFTHLLFDSAQYDYLINLSIGILIFDAFILLIKNILRAEERAISFVFFSLLNIVSNFLFNYVFVKHYLMGVNGIYWANLLSSGLTFVLLLPIAMKHFIPTITQSMLIRMLKFGLPFLPSTLAIFVMDSSDRFFIKHFLGLEATGIYGAGYKLALVIKLFVNAFQFAWIPFFISLANDKNAKEIFSKILTYFTLICSLVFLFFSMYMDQVIRFNFFGYTIMGKEYWGSTQIVPVVILAYICYGIYLNFLVGIYLKEKTKYLIYITGVGAITNILGNLLLIPSFKLMGAAYATLLSYLSMTIFLYFIAQQYYPIKYEWSKLAKVGLFSAIVFVAIEKISLPYETYTKLILLVGYLIFLYYSRFFDSREISRLKMLFQGFHGKISAR